MRAVASAESEFGGLAWLRRGRWLSFSPFDPNTPHLRWAFVSILILWLAVLSGLHFVPKQYVSKSTLIVPGASTSVNVALDKIGQASSSPVSAYNTGALSPKVIYKEMITSDEIRLDAARALGINVSKMAAPRIKLVDETALINIEMRSASPETAWQQNAALIDALQRRLDRLRTDELERRQSTVQDNLAVYELNMTQARERIVKLQSDTGLQSATQFTELATSLIRRTQRLGELRADLDRMEREQDVLALRVGVTPQTAAVALKIMADPTNAKIVADLADARAAFDVERKRLGPESPVLIQLQRRLDSVTADLAAVTSHAGLSDPAKIELLVMLTNASHQADLFKRLVGNESSLEGRRAEVATTARDVADLETQHARLGRVASALEDMKKTQLVAEAVFTTAMARIGTSKSDIFGSYPLVQTLSSPSLPDAPGGTQGLYTIAGGVLGTLLLALAWFLAWLRTGSVQRTLKNA